MSDILKELHEDLLQAEINHRENEVEAQRSHMARHEEQLEHDHFSLLRDLRKAEIQHDENKLIRQEQEDEKEQAALNKAQGKPEEAACEKAEEFKRLADQARSEQVLNEDLFETPIQPLK